MADQGALPPTLPPRLIEDGIYLDLPMEDYVNDPAVSGSGHKKLITSPPDFKWELPRRNPLYTPPESDARAVGTMVHAAVLEGMDAFHDRYFVAPEVDDDDPRLIRTADHAKAWLKDHGEKCTGLKAELFERVHAQAELMRLAGAAEDELPVFLDQMLADLAAQGNGRREKIKQRTFEYVAQVERVVRSWPSASSLLNGGLSEVSIFWTEKIGAMKVRFKARLDYLSATAYKFRGVTYTTRVVDAKKFGQPPRRGMSLRQHLAQEAINYCYDVQAVHNNRAAMQIPLLLQPGGGEVSATGDSASQRIDLLKTMADAIVEAPPEFFWLYLRTPGPPQGFIKRFPREAERYRHCEWEIEHMGLENLRRYRDACGDELDAEKPWIETGEEDWDDDDVREYQKEIAR